MVGNNGWDVEASDTISDINFRLEFLVVEPKIFYTICEFYLGSYF